jgi:hypothetical protein
MQYTVYTKISIFKILQHIFIPRRYLFIDQAEGVYLSEIKRFIPSANKWSSGPRMGARTGFCEISVLTFS